MSDNILENILESNEVNESGLNKSLESIKESIEVLKEKGEEKDKLFFIVVEELQKIGLELPNRKIIDIKEKHIGDDHLLIIHFKDNVSMIFNKNSSDMLTQIKGERYPMSGDEATHYKEKYYPYALKFIEMRVKVLQEESLLAKVRLQKLGI